MDTAPIGAGAVAGSTETPEIGSNNPEKTETWSGHHLKTAAVIALTGLSIKAIMDRNSSAPACQALIKYAISLTPAALYLIATGKVDPSLSFEAHRDFETETKIQAGIAESEKICSVSTVVWLTSPKDSFLPQQKLKEAFDEIKNGENELLNTIQYLLKRDWSILEMSGGRAFHSKDKQEFGVNPKINDFSFSGTEFTGTIPLRELEENEGLLCFLVPLPGQNGIPHSLVVLKSSEGEFTIYDSIYAKSIDSDSEQACMERLTAIAKQANKTFLLLVRVSPPSNQ